MNFSSQVTYVKVPEIEEHFHESSSGSDVISMNKHTLQFSSLYVTSETAKTSRRVYLPHSQHMWKWIW